MDGMVNGRRVGHFFVVLGGFLLVLFVASDLAEQPNFNVFFFGLAGVVIGLILIGQNRAGKVETERFRWIRNMLNRRKRDKYK
jgi:hypothetical protein